MGRRTSRKLLCSKLVDSKLVNMPEWRVRAMFVGRTAELEGLEREYATPGFRMTVVYGRRRVGKTTLLRRFSEGKRCVFFTAVEGGLKGNLDGMEAAFPPERRRRLESFEQALGLVAEMSEEGRLVFVIDEYPYLVRADRSASSVLQKTIDWVLERCDVHLILCGSSLSMMVDQVLSLKGPLHGRKTSELELRPLGYLDSARLLDGFSLDDRFRIYSMVGGVPPYLRMFDPAKTLEENMVDCFFRQMSALRGEPAEILRMEGRDVGTYADVLGALARGNTQVSRIADAAGMDTAAVSNKLRDLAFLNVVERREPMGSGTARKSSYAISDNLFRFHYRFVAGSGTAEETDPETSVGRVAPELGGYLGRAFEDVCREYARSVLKYPDVGTWWGSDPSARTSVEIDVVATGRKEAPDEYLLAECKYTRSPAGTADLEQLLRAAASHPCGRRRLAVFSASGFDDRLRAKARDEGVLLVSMDDLYSGLSRA